MRIVRKVPDLLDHFIERTKQLLSDKNHGVLLCGVTLAIEICRSDDGALEDFRQEVPLLVRHLKVLVTTGYSPEHDVSGITDPFLQVKILRLLRLLGRDHAAASESMNDVLAQVATNTEASKNVGNSILYETVLTILEIEAENGLRVMAINILGKFLGNRDNNIRYVALNTLNKVVSMDTNAVQRHRNIIIDCLRDGDISIRRRALELSYALINEGNVRILTRELLAFLEVADNEFKLGLTTQICLAAERYAPNKRWHLDTMLRVLRLAGNYVREEVLSSFIRLTCHTPELQLYTAQRLYAALHRDFSQESLTLASVWVIGEFGEILLQGGSFEDEEVMRQVHAKEIVDTLASVLESPYANSHIRQWVLTSLAKLTARIEGDGASQSRIIKLLHDFDTSVDVELQQRAVEFEALLSRPNIRDGVLEPMPPPEIKQTVIGTVSEKREVGSTRRDKDALLDLMGDEGSTSTDATVATNGVKQQTTQDLLADIFGGMGDEPSSSSAAAMASPSAGAPKSTMDDIMGLFGSTDNGTSNHNNNSLAGLASPTSVPSASSGSGLDGLDLLGSSQSYGSSIATTTSPSTRNSAAAATPPPTTTIVTPQQQNYSAYDQKGLRVTLTPNVNPARPEIVNITARFEATSSTAITSVNFQAAVPKVRKDGRVSEYHRSSPSLYFSFPFFFPPILQSQKLQMLAISNSTVSPGKAETQQMRVMAPKGAQVRLRLRVGFSVEGGQQVQDQVDFAGFPAF